MGIGIMAGSPQLAFAFRSDGTPTFCKLGMPCDNQPSVSYLDPKIWSARPVTTIPRGTFRTLFVRRPTPITHCRVENRSRVTPCGLCRPAPRFVRQSLQLSRYLANCLDSVLLRDNTWSASDYPPGFSKPRRAPRSRWRSCLGSSLRALRRRSTEHKG